MKFEKAIRSILGEARDNQVSERNAYSTELVIQTAEQSNDRYDQAGNIILVDPERQPCDYSRFVKKSMCIMDPNQKDWGMFTQYMKPSGVTLTMLFQRSEKVISKKRMPDNMIHIVVAYNRPVEQVVGTNNPEEIGQFMYQKAQQELGLSEAEMIYSEEYLTQYAREMVELGNGYMWEIYDSKNRLVKMKDFQSYLRSQGTSFEEVMRFA